MYGKVTETSPLIMAFGNDKSIDIQVYFKEKEQGIFQAECRGGGVKSFFKLETRGVNLTLACVN